MSNLNSLDFNLLKALHVLLEERNVTRAAERLALTQPAVSGMLNRLRHKLGDPLFVRSARGIIPTDRALALAEPLQKIINDIEQLVAPSHFEPATLERTFTLGMTDNAIHCVGIPLLLTLQKIAPKVRLVFLSIQGRDIEKMLEQGELDLAVICDPAVSPNLFVRRLHHERYVCAMREQHPILQKKWTLDSFCSLNFVLVSLFGDSFVGVTDKALEKIGSSRNVVLSVQSFAIVPELLRQSDLAAVVPHHLVRNAHGIITREIPFEVEGYDKVMTWHERTQHDPVQKWLRDVMLQLEG
ncbi:LysR family transcriptional regulator [Bisgaard Taxon 10/6]|uniref:LysR family transcriptional regulator n=1 Tax=Exercitatus varius TaxID=67857 RepID=UPI00294AE7F1|nr:LysR family transcriptional regulator [Exercitatus varius]MDG2954815.1 LysR family transcriptional regulator [Exercitatus varius]